MKKIIQIAGIALITILTSCSKKEKAEEHEVLPENIVEMTEDQYRMSNIQLGMVEMRVIGSVIKAGGQITVPPQSVVSMCAPLGGYIKTMNLVQGSLVSKGQVIATIENTVFIEIQQDYLESKSKLEFVESDLKRQKELLTGNAGTSKTMQQVQSDYQGLKAKVNGLEQKLLMAGINTSKLTAENISRAATVVSPLDGFVRTVNVNPGKYVNPTDVMFELIGRNDIAVELVIFEKDAVKVSIGQQIRFSLPDMPDNELTAVVNQTGMAVNEDKTIRVYGKIEATNKSLLPGMFINGLIETGNESVTSLPADAVVTFDSKDYIFVSKGKRSENNKTVNDFLMVEVKKGISVNGFIGVMLPQGFDTRNSKIVIKGAFDILAKKKNGGEMSC